MNDKVTLDACPPGLFWFDDGKRSGLGVKTEYVTRVSDGTLMPDAFVVETGEYFWGGPLCAGGCWLVAYGIEREAMVKVAKELRCEQAEVMRVRWFSAGSLSYAGGLARAAEMVEAALWRLDES